MNRFTLDVTPVMQRPSGMGLYVVNLIQGLMQVAEQEAFELQLAYQPRLGRWLRADLTPPPALQSVPNLRVFPVPVRLSNLWLRYPIAFHPRVEQWFGQPDLVHGTNYSVFPFRHSRRVMTLYDLTFMRYPQFTHQVVKTYTHQVKRCLRWTDGIITISESSKRDIVEFLGVPSDRVFVTPLASRYSIPDPTLENPWQKPYLLFVSTIEPRKNVVGLIQAFNALKAQNGIEHDLILIGQKGWLYESVFNAIAQSPYRDSIHHLSYLPDAQVMAFYQFADVFVYPSYYEGFGLPVLEAMTLGAPVVTSHTASLPEVAGLAALLINPYDIAAMATAISKVISDRAFRQQLRDRGYEQAKKFSWLKTAKKTIATYHQILSG
ncbi:MAG: glycosyltransferase family 1 protein [Synechococcales bacterium]|nr:glycosyltransferase family 1 protein [Synechococcales bacterium]